jgi:UDP-N-acetylglucosamine acyltransferase
MRLCRVRAYAIFYRLQFALRADMGRLGVEMQIHPTAQVESGAEIAEDAYIGPSCIVERDVVIGAGCRLVANVYVSGRTTIGPRTVVHPFACLGGPPQSVAYKGEPTSLVIGADCTIRESVTMSRGTAGGGGETIVGDGGFLMAYSHVAHDCRIGREAIFANGATLAGHCVLGDNVFLSGQVLVHQFTHIGAGAMISGGAGIRGDIIPFGLAAGEQARLVGVNVVGMRRRRYPVAAVQAVRSAFRMLFLTPGVMAERVAATDAALGHVDAVAEILAFLRAPRTRPLCQARGGTSRDEALAEAS